MRVGHGATEGLDNNDAILKKMKNKGGSWYKISKQGLQDVITKEDQAMKRSCHARELFSYKSKRSKPVQKGKIKLYSCIIIYHI